MNINKCEYLYGFVCAYVRERVGMCEEVRERDQIVYI